MRICPTCRTAYPARGRATCTKDGTRLIGAEEYAASKSDPLLGATVGGRYDVVERIGTGGMGTVYRARQSGLDRPVALKVLKRDLISDRDTVARFHREAKAMSMLMHPNTVRVFDFGEDEDEGHLYLAMELLEGELLTAWIEREVTPPVHEAVEVIAAILRSLAEAHSKALIHRDLKPDNIFLAKVEGHSQPVVKVLDFGIAKVFREELKIDQLETQAGTVFGTPRYMSPEQAQGSSLDHRSDLYAVGVLLYQLLTGDPPFLDEDAVVVMAKHIREQPELPHKLAPHQPIPRRLERAVLKALAKDPDARFENADAFEDELRACLPDVEEEQIRMRTGRSPGFIGSLPRVPLMVAAALLLMATGIAAIVIGTSQPEEVAEAQVALPSLDDPEAGYIAGPEESRVPEPAAPAPTEVEVRSEPAGAEVFVGDESRGTTPVTLAVDADEALEVELRLARYETASLSLTADSEPLQEVALTRVARPTRVARDRPSTTGQPSTEPAYERW
ncbi:MAG: serine/threonine protein kinase [Sandaracinaceae bacterium]